ncbi:MAG TPA: AsmA family protein [Rhizomicrobium sp.]
MAIDVVRDPDGRSNWQFSKHQEGWNVPPIRHFVLNDGRVSVDDEERKLTFDGTVSSRENAGAASDRAFQLTGSGTLNRKPFTADVHGGALIHVDESRPYRFAADVRAGETHVVVEGDITKPFHFGHYAATATVSGRNLSDLYDLTELALPGTPPYRISGSLVRDGALYRFEHFSGTVGASDLGGSLSVDVSGDVPAIRGSVASRSLAFADLGALFGSERGISHAASAPGLLPDTRLHVDRLRHTDAEVDFTAAAERSRDFPLRGLATHISLENGVLLLKPLAFDFPRGRIAGFIRVDARRPLAVTTLDARVTGARIEQFFHSPEKTLSGALAARAVLKGTGNSVREAAFSADGALTAVVPEGRIRRSIAEWLGVNVISVLGLTLSGDASDTGLRCVIAHFNAHDGVLTSQELVFDTDPVLVTGSGRIDLRHETIDLGVAGKPKSFQLMHLNVPVTVTGALSHPTVGIKPGPAVMQAGFAAALGFLTPLAAILPFVDANLAKNANCTALVAGAGTEKAPVKVHRR